MAKFELKPLPEGFVPGALKKAEHYRLLNDPEAAESVALDVLDVEPDNQRARIIRLLALIDQFGKGQGTGGQRTREVIATIDGDYEREYYAGLVCERQAIAVMTRRGPRVGCIAYDGLRSAMEHYTKARELRPGSGDATLRYNMCVRILNANPYLGPDLEEGQHMLE